MQNPRKTRISLLLASGVTVVALLAVGFGVRFAAQTRSAENASANPDAVTSAQELPTSTAQPLKGTEPEEGKVGQPPAGGRQLLFNSEIQTHLLAVAEVQKVNGVEMSISDFYQSQGHLYVSVCFATLGVEGWPMGPATLSYTNGEVSWFAVHPTIDERGSSDGTPGRHCETLEFDQLPAGATLSGLSLRVESVMLAYPEEFHECETYKARWDESERMKKLGIVVDCSLVPGWTQFAIRAKPAAMTDEEALTIAGQEAAGMIIGPWVFTKANLIAAK